jgi:hypothetical protein
MQKYWNEVASLLVVAVSVVGGHGCTAPVQNVYTSNPMNVAENFTV